MTKRSWTEARAKVDAEGRCRVCGGPNPEAAHLIPRSRVRPGAGEHPDNIVPLDRECHALFDAGQLDLLPYLTPVEQAKAAELHPGGMLGALGRVTGVRWAPESEAA